MSFTINCWTVWLAGLEEDPCGSARGKLAIQPQHLLQANGCYNLINVMKLDIIP